MREIRTEVEISAPPEKVWSVLTDFEGWQNWNPISQAKGSSSVGSRLNVSMCGKDGKVAQRYAPVVTSSDKPSLFRWRATMMAGFLFTNDKIFELQKSGTGTNLIHKELFGGLLVPMFWGKFEKFVPPMLNSMNDALKKTVEKS